MNYLHKSQLRNGIILTAILFLLFFETKGQEWKLAKVKSGVTVYTREADGSPIKEFKANKDFNAPLHQVKEAILDIENYSNWYDHCKTAEVVKTGADGSMIYYVEYSMPFPFNNRDVVSELTVTESDKEIMINLTQKEGIVDEKDGIIRMPVAKGVWKLTKIDDQHTQVLHQYLGDPAGNIPGGIVNMFLVAGPINTLTKLEELLKENK